MKKSASVLFAALSLASFATSAEPVQMTDLEMSKIVAGKQTMTMWTDGTSYMLRPTRQGAPSADEFPTAGEWLAAADTPTCTSGRDCSAIWQNNPSWTEYTLP